MFWKKKCLLKIIILCCVFILFLACSIKNLAVNVIADSLSGGGGGTVFTGDADPELIGEALPFALKLYESLLEQTPENTGLLLTTGLGFTLYANAYVQAPAGMLPDEEYELQEFMLLRAKALYLRGRAYVFRALELKYPGFTAAIDSDLPGILEIMDQEDVPYLYVAGASWMGAFSTNPFDMQLLMTVPRAVSLLERAQELDETYMNGSIHDLFISIYGSLPAALGGSEEKARYHFAKAVELSGGLSVSPYVALAGCGFVKGRNLQEFQDLLQTALDIDLEQNPDNRLLNTLNQRKARWMLSHLGDYFLLDIDDEGELGGEDL
jgi:predicted anti-sigma-YlaC factor YlaD